MHIERETQILEKYRNLVKVDEMDISYVDDLASVGLIRCGFSMKTEPPTLMAKTTPKGISVYKRSKVLRTPIGRFIYRFWVSAV